MGNTTPSDSELLAEWLKHRRESAFHALVVRYAPLVHMAAKRTCGDESLAADASQLVFILLAQKAKSLSTRTSLAGWLHLSAILHAKRLSAKRRSEHRKLQHLYSAMEPSSDSSNVDSWADLQPVLDAAIASLSENDREAILLRFYRSLSVKEIAATLGIATDAAQKRLDRATERLREKLTRRGITTAGSLSAVMLAGYASEAKAATISTSLLSSKAIAASAVGSTGIASIALLIMTKKTIIASIALLLLTGGAAVAVKHPSLFSKSASATREKRLAEFDAKNPPAKDSIRTSGSKTFRTGSAADAGLIAKYGESRVKLARYTLVTLLDINEAGISMMTDSMAMMPPGKIESEMQAKEMSPVLGSLGLSPTQLTNLSQLYKESFRRHFKARSEKISFVRANATAAKELLLAADASGKGKAPLEEYQRLRDASPSLNDTLNHLLRKNPSGNSADLALNDPTFVAEFTKVLDPSQTETFNRFVETEDAKIRVTRLDMTRLGLEGIDERNQQIKSMLDPTKQALDAFKKLRGKLGNREKIENGRK